MGSYENKIHSRFTSLFMKKVERQKMAKKDINASKDPVLIPLSRTSRLSSKPISVGREDRRLFDRFSTVSDWQRNPI